MSGSEGVPPATADLLERLAAAVEGLVYSSESDRPFEVFFLPAAAVPEPLTGEAFAAALALDAAGAPIEEWSLDRLLRRHIEYVEPADRVAWERLPRYDALKRLLAGALRDLRVFRIGRVQIDCFALGRDAAGNLVGLRTVAIET
jgi:hypothetical protein